MNQLWSGCVDIMATKVNSHVAATWFAPITCEEVTEDKITLSAPNTFFISWIQKNYIKLIRDSVTQLTGKEYDIELRPRNDSAEELSHIDDSAETEQPEPVKVEPITDELALKHNLNPRYTFDRYVVGDCNRLANAAALAITENLGKIYNPLFLYGGVGLGKTHLMSSIGFKVLSENRNRRIFFTTSEEFTNEMVNAIRYDRMTEFREKYRTVDLLMIDDIQFIAGKERTEVEFFHTFNSVCENRNQVVITSDRPPSEIPNIAQRLRSRFKSGLIENLGVPDLETRVAIVKKKASHDAAEVSDEVAYYLAEQVRTNVRELEGCLTRVIALSSLRGVPIDLELAKQAVGDLAPHQTRNLTVDDVINYVARFYNVKASDIKSKKKAKIYVVPRQLCMFLARELTEYSYPVIGSSLGGRDHSTVIYACRKVEKTLQSDPSFCATVDRLKKEIRG